MCIVRGSCEFSPWCGSSGCDYRGWQVSVVAGLVLVGVITEGGR